MMEGPTAIRSQTPDWRHTHTGAGTINSNNIPSILTPYQHQQIKSTKSHSYLPSLAHLDLAKILRDGQLKNGNEIKHLSPIVTNITTTTTGTKTTDQINSQPLSSPVGAYPGPPPPYSSLVTTSTSGAMGNQTTYASQHNPELRRTNNGEKEHHQVLPSLPSIHEALGKEPGPFYRTTPRLSSIPKPTSMLISSPTNSIHSIHAHAPNHYDSHMSRPTDPPPPPPPPPSQRPIFETPQRDSQFEEPRRYHHPEPQSAHRVPPVQSPHIHLRPQSQSQPTTPSFFPAPSRQNGQNGPTSQSGPHYETSHPPAYSYPPPSSHTIQAPSLTGNRRNDDYPRSEDDRRTHTAGNSINSSKGSPGPFHHGESVKRHLETFDLELGLNEIAEASSKTLEFARKFADKAHHMQRSGIATALPTLGECDEMHNLQRSVMNSMERIREIVVTQQHALAEQRSRDAANKARQAYDAEHVNNLYDKEEGDGGFAGPDPKKRRGRHAPPGRCHSCARSETPEWRRGPDGARTLCNACGLHYAKLTRKLGSKVPLLSSNLRPKDNGAPSP